MGVWIINNLAVADICNCVLVLLPTLLTQYGKLSRSLIFREKFYDVFGCYKYIFLVSNLILVNILSLNKLMRCLFPLNNLDSKKRNRIFVTLLTCFASTVPSLWTLYGVTDGFLLIDHSWEWKNYLGAAYMGFAYRNHNIGHIRIIINFVLIGIFNALPCVTLVIINSALLILACRKANSAINKKNLLIVVIVTVSSLISILHIF